MPRNLLCLILTICGLGYAPFVRAQADFRPGYIVPLSGDTVRGLADYRGGVRNAEQCRFRPTAGAEATIYTPAQLRGYGFGNGRHYRAQLLAAIDSVQYQAIPSPRLVFLELLAAGPLTLYQLRSRTGVDRFFIAPATAVVSQPVTELIASRPPDSGYLTRAYRRAPLYRGVLTALMGDCPAVRLEVASVPCTASALTGLVQRYNACQTAAPVAATAAPVVLARAGERVRLGVVAGVERSRFSVSGESFLVNGNFTSTQPVVGLGLSIPFASISEKLSLRVEALVEHQRYADAFLAGAFVGAGTYEQVQLKLTYLRVPLMVRYTYPAGKLRPFAQAGLSYAQRLSLSSSVQAGRVNSRGIIEYDAPKTLEDVLGAGGVVGYEIGLVGSLGAHLPAIAGRDLTFELRAESSSGLIITSGIKSSQQRYFALLSYNFTK